MAGALVKSWSPPKVKTESKQKRKRPLGQEEKKLQREVEVRFSVDGERYNEIQ